VDVELVQQLLGMSRVLGGDDVRFLQDADGTEGYVLEVPMGVETM